MATNCCSSIQVRVSSSRSTQSTARDGGEEEDDQIGMAEVPRFTQLGGARRTAGERENLGHPIESIE